MNVMEPGLLKKYIQNIEDFVFIEEKIVTYLWLCQILKVHVNIAKQLLYVFSKKDDFQKRLLVTHVVGGELKNGKGKLLKLVIADSREAVKQIFSKITTDHVYSIQQSGGSYSSTDLYNSYPHFSIATDNRKFCPIQPCKEIEKREVKHITEVKNYLNSKPVVKPSAPKVSEEPKKDVKEDIKIVAKNDNTADDVEPPQKQRKLSGNDKDVKGNKAGSIGSFFNRQAEKAEKKSLGSPAENKQKLDKKDEKAKSGIGAFFKPGNKNDIEKSKNEEKKAKEVNHKVETKEVEKEPEVKEPKNVKKPTEASTKDKKVNGKAKKRKRKKKDEEDGSKKKRKRIMSVLSSDSESASNGSNESEMEVEPEEPPPAPPLIDDEEDIIPPTPGRKRVRKEIDKLFTDDEGFVVTKKEFVYESCSDDEGKGEKEKSENKENNKETEKKVLPVQEKTPERKDVTSNSSKKNKSSNNDKNNKQSSITNFFTRKATS